jgi:hypothetical protein
LRIAAADNLAAGWFRLVIAADKITDELRRIPGVEDRLRQVESKEYKQHPGRPLSLHPFDCRFSSLKWDGTRTDPTTLNQPANG